MHLNPVSLGLALVTVNIAVLLSSSLRLICPADHASTGFAVVAEKAACEAWNTSAPTASIASGVMVRPRTTPCLRFTIDLSAWTGVPCSSRASGREYEQPQG